MELLFQLNLHCLSLTFNTLEDFFWFQPSLVCFVTTNLAAAVQWIRQRDNSTSTCLRLQKSQPPYLSLVYLSCTVQQTVHTGRRSVVVSSIAGICGTRIFTMWNTDCWASQPHEQLPWDKSIPKAKCKCLVIQQTLGLQRPYMGQGMWLMNVRNLECISLNKLNELRYWQVVAGSYIATTVAGKNVLLVVVEQLFVTETEINRQLKLELKLKWKLHNLIEIELGIIFIIEISLLTSCCHWCCQFLAILSHKSKQAT